MAMRPSSSSFSNRFSYDVFLSFRGEDTRYGFTGNLCDALRKKGIHTFMDDLELQIGDEITPALEKAIEESRISIIVLSQDYASSSFCLNELAHIHKFKEEKGVLVIPIFHKVDPSDVQNQKGEFGEALANQVKKYDPPSEKLETWKKALNHVANLSGYTFKANGEKYEHNFIEEIVQFVSRKINRTPLHLDNDLVGLESQVLKVEELLDVGSDDIVHMVGIHGPGGMGKTTLAVRVHNSIAHHFEALCYLANVRETSKQHGLTHLQSILLSNTVEEKEIKITSEEEGSSVIKHRLQNKKVLLILDDVDDTKQLEAIIGSSDWFGGGSRVIITTRDKQLLASHRVERTYQVKELNKEDALQLLSSKAFKSKKIDPRYQDVLNEAVTYASGLPLALKVIGSNLCGKTIELWESALNDYKRIPDKKIQEVLKVSYDGLGEKEQSVFLDISCCFKGYTLTKVEDILRAHYDGHCMKNHIETLVDKSLIDISSCDSKVTLHDLIEDMGKEIVRTESPKDPGRRRRLWLHEDIVEVLEDNKGTTQIEIIHMDLIFLKQKVEWDGNAFREMKNLKTLIIKGWNDIFSTGPKHLPNSLRVLVWGAYPSQDFPNDFHPKKLAICNLPRSKRLSSGFAILSQKKFTNLTSLNFKYCQDLTEIPDLSHLRGLKKLSFESCHNLLTVHKSVGSLEKLKILKARCCCKLKSFPPIKLTSLERLELGLCVSLESFPEVLEKMENIKYLSLAMTSIKKFPLSFENLIGLEELNLSENNFKIIPECFKEFRSLTSLNLDNCESLQEIRGIPPNLKCFSADRCISLTSSCRSMLLSQELHEAGYTNFRLPTTEIPEWFKYHSWKPPISFWVRKELPAIAICLHMASVDDCSFLEYEDDNNCEYLYRLEDGLVYSIKKYAEMSLKKCGSLILIINGNEHKCFNLSTNVNTTYLFDLRAILRTEHAHLKEKRTEDKLNEALLENDWNHVQIICKDDASRRMLMKSRIHVLKQQSMEDIQFNDPCTTRKSNDNLNSSHQNMEVAEAKTLCWRRSSEDFSDDINHSIFCELPKSRFTSPELAGFLSKKKFKNLTILNFDKCQCLREIPDVSFLQQLEKLSFQWCCNLLTIHESVGSLEKLKILKARCCCKLKSFPRINLTSLKQLDLVSRDSLESFPPIKLTSLEQLHLDGCQSLESFPEVSGKMENIKYLSLFGTSIKEFPLSFENLTGLEQLNLSMSNFEILPECFKEFRSLTTLNLDNCESLQEIRGIPPNLKRFSANGCDSLTSSCKSMLLSQELHEAGYTNFCLPSANIPEWFERQSRGLPISFRVRKELPAIAICFHMASVDDYSLLEYEGYNSYRHEYLYRLEDGLVYSTRNNKYNGYDQEDPCSFILIINGNEHDCFTFSMDPDNTYLFDLREILRTKGADLIVKPKERTEDKLNEALPKQEWINVQIIYKCDGRRILMKSGIHVLKEQSRDDIHFIDDLNSSDIESENMEVAETKTLCWSYYRYAHIDDVCVLPEEKRFTSPELGGRDAAIFLRDICMRPKEDESVDKVSSTVSSNIQHLSLRNCNLSDEFFPIALQWFKFANVKELDLSENNFTVIPESIKECHFLTKLALERCRRLQEIRWLPPNLKHFSATGCLSLSSSSRSMLLDQELHEAGNTNFYLPGADIPEWFEYQTSEQSISFRFYNKLPAIAICLVREDEDEDEDENCVELAVVREDEDEDEVYEWPLVDGKRYYGYQWMGKGTTTRLLDLRDFKFYFGGPPLGNGWYDAKITYGRSSKNESKSFLVKSGIHILEQQSSVEDIQFITPLRKRKLESQNQQLLKKQRLVDMQVADTTLMAAPPIRDRVEMECLEGI